MRECFFVNPEEFVNVPFDPNLDYIFVGEEILHSARFWTSGYDIYTPTENIVYHLYTRNNQPKIWTDIKYDDTPAHNKIKFILQLKGGKIFDQLKPDIDKYYLGKKRSLKEYYNFCGIDVNNQKSIKNFCRPVMNEDRSNLGSSVKMNLPVMNEDRSNLGSSVKMNLPVLYGTNNGNNQYRNRKYIEWKLIILGIIVFLFLIYLFCIFLKSK